MPLQNLSVITGLIDGSSFETPGFIIDLTTYEPLLFGISPRTHRLSKSLVKEDHIIPGRHGPLMEPVAGGAEIIQLDILFRGFSELAMGATKQAANFLMSLMHPDRGGAIAALGALASGNFDRSENFVTQVGHSVSLTYGLWMIERQMMLTRLEVDVGPGEHPIAKLPYRALCRMTLQEDEPGNIDITERRHGIPSF